MCVGRELPGNEHCLPLKINQNDNFPLDEAVFHDSLSTRMRLVQDSRRNNLLSRTSV